MGPATALLNGSKKASSPSSQLVGNCFFFGAMPKKKNTHATPFGEINLIFYFGSMSLEDTKDNNTTNT